MLQRLYGPRTRRSRSVIFGPGDFNCGQDRKKSGQRDVVLARLKAPFCSREMREVKGGHGPPSSLSTTRPHEPSALAIGGHEHRRAGFPGEGEGRAARTLGTPAARSKRVRPDVAFEEPTLSLAGQSSCRGGGRSAALSHGRCKGQRRDITSTQQAPERKGWTSLDVLV